MANIYLSSEYTEAAKPQWYEDVVDSGKDLWDMDEHVLESKQDYIKILN